MADFSGHKCETADCNNPASLQCPTCLKMGIQGSYFCSQDCFKSYWKSHKIIHMLASKFLSQIKMYLINKKIIYIIRRTKY